MDIRVYFGPKKHCPADELPRDERLLWLRDFHFLRGVERDFWTNNPMMLDFFQPDQIMLWSNERWRTLRELVAELLPDIPDDTLTWMRPAQKALMCEMASEARVATQSEAQQD